MKKEKAKILVVEDEQSMIEVLKMLLEEEGYDVVDASTKEISPETPVIMITAFGTIESAIEAMKQGAYDYIHKPFKIDEIRLIARNALDKKRLKTEVSLLREKVKTAYKTENIIGKSPKMQVLLALIPKVAGTNANALITGESGTGKELVANAIHNLSDRDDKNFVAVNCASFPEGLLESEIFGHMKGAFTGAIRNKQGLFEIADAGPLFLDEVGDMPLSLQSKLLRAIETNTFRRVGGTTDIKVDARIISATNKDIKKEAETGSFREDLYFRLNVIPLHIPPLRERKEDIPLMVEHFCNKYSEKRRQFSGNALNMFMNCEWKGNVRELENTVERVLLFTDTEIITELDLPQDIREFSYDKASPASVDGGIELEKEMAEVEKKYLLEALEKTGGKKTEAAKLLGISFRSFRHKLSKYGL
jgi:two-component system response regulator PilR (NtrC family)